MLMTGCRRRSPRRGFVPQAQAAHQRQKNASAPPSYGQVSSSSKVHRREGYLASVQMQLVIFTLLFCSSAECSFPAATASHRRRKRSGQRPGHYGRVRATEATANDPTSSKVHRLVSYLSEHARMRLPLAPKARSTKAAKQCEAMRANTRRRSGALGATELE
jgi:hypothetical protein